MRSSKLTSLFIFFAVALLCVGGVLYYVQTQRISRRQLKVILVRTPDGGIQPQVAVDRTGGIHLVYFKGDSEAGDLFYVNKPPGAAAFSPPIRVNSVPGSAGATGTVRAAQLALGKGGRVHVAWMGFGKSAPRSPSGNVPMLYTRLNDDRTAFEPQRNVMQFTSDLDGGSSVAADGSGNVYVVWHGNLTKGGEESSRTVWIARSKNDGITFAPEVAVSDPSKGACGCCGMRAFADEQGAIYILYRTAGQSVHRDMYLLVSTDHGDSFSGKRIDPWELNACPMSTASINESGSSLLLAWQTSTQVFYARVDRGTNKISERTAAPRDGSAEGDDANNRKHPAVVGNSRGETLLAWTEGTAWKRGGKVAWQVFDSLGQPSGQKGMVDGVPVWGLLAVFVQPNGDFTIIY